ncbi:MAG TPA: PPC domain-containing DNA-binding protein [Acidobacteriota bacterium]|nr:PPC domain-containing DNA-binding protein [Acidobacteriota bacterium]
MRCQKTPQGYMVRLEKGEEVHAALTRFMREKRIGGGNIIGIGTLTDVTLGYFDLVSREYRREQYTDEYELINLTGNLSYADGEPLLHAHVVLSGPDMRAFAGHLFAGTIAVTGEFAVTVADTEWRRAFDEATGLKLLDFAERL